MSAGRQALAYGLLEKSKTRRFSVDKLTEAKKQRRNQMNLKHLSIIRQALGGARVTPKKSDNKGGALKGAANWVVAAFLFVYVQGCADPKEPTVPPPSAPRCVAYLAAPLPSRAFDNKTAFSLDDIPEGGVNLLAQHSLSKTKIVRDGFSVLPKKLTGEAYVDVLEATTSDKLKNVRDASVRCPVKGMARKGDALLFVITLKCASTEDESGMGRVGIRISQRKRPFLEKKLSVPGEWKTFFIPFSANSNGGLNAFLSFGGFKKQTLILGSCEILDYGKRVKLSQLPKTRIGYDGMAPDAPWRAKAAARIDKYRRANLNLKVVDKTTGEPIENATVKIEQTGSSFAFGVTMSLWHVKEIPATVTRILDAGFNKLVPPNAMKWRHHNPKGLKVLFPVAEKLGVPVRGHTLIWGSFRRADKGVEKRQKYYKSHPEELRQLLLDHIKEYASLYKGKVVEWDVVNEPVPEHQYVDILGKNEMLAWFREAREILPHTKLYINDYQIVAGNRPEHRRGYREYIKFLLDHDAPLDGIGLQCHFRGPVPPAEMYRRMNEFAGFGKEMQVTEFTYPGDDKELQTRFATDFYILAFSHPKIVGVMNWHYSDFFDSKGKERPLLRAARELFVKRWRTNESLETDSKGTVSSRVFKGTYRITVSNGGKRKSLGAEIAGDKKLVVEF